MDDLKATVVKAALEGAVAAVVAAVVQTHEVEVFPTGRLERQLRLRARDRDQAGQGPRYFLVKVSEPI